MPPTRSIRTRAEIAEANQALIARRRHRLHLLQNQPVDLVPGNEISIPGKYYLANIDLIVWRKFSILKFILRDYGYWNPNGGINCLQ